MGVLKRKALKVTRGTAMSKTIVFSNQKGGVGKTTCTRELGIYLSDIGHKVLLIDADPQANLSKSLAEDPSPGLYEALSGAEYSSEQVKEGLWLLSGDIRLAGLEKSLIGELDAYTRLRDFLTDDSRFPTVDYVLIDSPPSLGVLTINALAASDHLIIPMNPSLYSMQGTTDLVGTMAKVRKSLNPGLSLLGVIINAFDSVPVITRQIRLEIEETFREKVFSTVLSKSIRIEEAIASKRGVTAGKGTRPSKISVEIKALGDELLERLGGRQT
jgi:chromosome partitioning protein